mgnify:CR=1 FL=1
MNKLIMIFLLMCSTVHAGKEGGNGGFVYQCGEKVHLIDLKEVEAIPYLKERIKIEPNQFEGMSYLEIIRTIISDRIGAYSEDLALEVLNKIPEVLSKMQTRRTIDNTIPDDLGYVPPIAGCKIVNVIEYRGIVLVDENLYHRLSEFELAAIVMHETLYSMAQKVIFNYEKTRLPDSIPIRRIIALLFSSNYEENKSILNDLLSYYIETFGREKAEEIYLTFCIDKKYVHSIDERFSLKQFIKKSTFYINEYKPKNYDVVKTHLLDVQLFPWKNSNERQGYFSYYYNSQHLAIRRQTRQTNLLKIKGKDLKLQSTRCDGYKGESYTAQTKKFKLQTRTPYETVYKIRSQKTKDIDASILIQAKYSKNNTVKTSVLLRDLVKKDDYYYLYTKQFYFIFEPQEKNYLSQQVLDFIEAR